jgi:hypothetical protein
MLLPSGDIRAPQILIGRDDDTNTDATRGRMEHAALARGSIRVMRDRDNARERVRERDRRLSRGGRGWRRR